MTGYDIPEKLRAVIGDAVRPGGLALYGAKGADAEQAADKLPLMYAELSEWFTQSACASYGGTSSTDIIGEGSGRPDPEHCGRLLVDTWGRTLEILVENGFDPANPGTQS